MAKFFVNDNGTVRQAKKVFFNDNGTVRQAKKIFVNDNGTVRKVFSASYDTGWQGPIANYLASGNEQWNDGSSTFFAQPVQTSTLTVSDETDYSYAGGYNAMRVPSNMSFGIFDDDWLISCGWLDGSPNGRILFGFVYSPNDGSNSFVGYPSQATPPADTSGWSKAIVYLRGRSSGAIRYAEITGSDSSTRYDGNGADFDRVDWYFDPTRSQLFNTGGRISGSGTFTTNENVDCRVVIET